MSQTKIFGKSKNKVDPRVKDVLYLLGAGTFLAGSFLMPSLTLLAKPFLDKQRKKENNEWIRFNTWRLKYILKRLHKQKYIEIIEDINGYCIKITDGGKKRLLMYNLDTMKLENKKWDGKWRIIIYDINERKKTARFAFRKILKKLKFLQLQKSVYLTPFACEEEIEYIRQIYNIGNDVVIIKVSGLENEIAYKEYFGIS